MKTKPLAPLELVDFYEEKLIPNQPIEKLDFKINSNILPLDILKETQDNDVNVPPSKHKQLDFFPKVIKAISKDRGQIKRFSKKKINQANETHLFGSDNRRILLDTTYPWRCIGKISWIDRKGKLHWGSATLVGNSFIITAAHVLPINDLNYRIKFVPNSFNGSPRVGNESYVTEVAYWEAVKDNVCGYDMVICKLAKALGNDLGYLGTRLYNDEWEDGNYWHHVGYPFDIEGGNVPCWQGPLAVVDDDSDSYNSMEIETLADIASGQSGGPIFANWGNDVRIIGVLSGYEEEFSYSFPFSFTEEHAVFSGGNALNRLVRWGRDNWG